MIRAKNYEKSEFLKVVVYSRLNETKVSSLTNKKNIALQTKLTHFLFDFGVVNTTDDDCEQRVPSVALGLQQLTTRAMIRRSSTLTTAVV